MRFARDRRGSLLAAASGIVFAASTPPTNLTLGILVGLVGLALSFDVADSREASAVRKGAARGFCFSLAANVVALRFVPEVIARFTPLPVAVGWIALLLLSAAQAVPWAIGGAITGSLRSRVPPVLAFASGVYVAISLPAVFPWTPAGGLARWPVLLQLAELVGERGTSFVLAAACGLVAGAFDAIRAERVRSAAALVASSALVFILVCAYGASRMASIEALRTGAPHARVALLEPDFDATFRWDERRAEMMLDRLSALTRQAEEAGAVLTVWPESAYPYTLPHGVRHSPHDHRAVLQSGVRGPVLTGAYLSKGGGVGTNSAVLVEPDGSIGPSYDKRHLLWFGETVPLADVFPVLARIFARGTGLAPGTESVAFVAGPIRAAVLNCYEDTLPAAGREAMAVRPNLLVNVTNDAWFAGSAEGELHLRLATLRAIETRRDLVRAVNRGPTTWVDANGRVRARLEATEGAGPPPPLLVDAALLSEPMTLYAHAGELPLRIGLVALVIGGLWRKRRSAK